MKWDNRALTVIFNYRYLLLGSGIKRLLKMNFLHLIIPIRPANYYLISIMTFSKAYYSSQLYKKYNAIQFCYMYFTRMYIHTHLGYI